MIDIKINKENEPDTPIAYPVIMIHEDDLHRSDPLIILFVEEQKGIILSCNSRDGVADFSIATDWDINGFVPYKGTITLSNKS